MLKDKALASLRRAAAAFNDFDDVGRTSTVLLHTQHAFEMLLKAGLVQKGVKVFDARDGRSTGFEKCVNLSVQHLGLTPRRPGRFAPSTLSATTSSTGSRSAQKDCSTCMSGRP